MANFTWFMTALYCRYDTNQPVVILPLEGSSLCVMHCNYQGPRLSSRWAVKHCQGEIYLFSSTVELKEGQMVWPHELMFATQFTVLIWVHSGQYSCDIWCHVFVYTPHWPNTIFSYFLYIIHLHTATSADFLFSFLCPCLFAETGKNMEPCNH